MISRDGANISLWQTSLPYNSNSIFNEATAYDVLIVGGGITGISTALQLQLQGLACVLIEGRTLGFGTTGGTTAHLNTFADEPYWSVKRNFGRHNAQLLADGIRSAMNLIRNNVAQYSIDCDYQTLPAYLYAIRQNELEQLEDIISSCKEVGVDMKYVQDTPLALPHLKIARAEHQAQFNPVSYIHGLAHEFEKAGGIIVQNCQSESVAPGEILQVQTTCGIIKARHLVYATHTPPGVNMVHFRCAPYRSYVLACKLKDGKYPEPHLWYDLCDPYHYIRTHTINGETFLIAGGEDHKTGHEENTNAPFRRLESFVRSHFEVEEVAYKWSSQYYESVDGLPFIGKMPGKGSNVYLATAFGGNGIIYGTLSAIIISELILKGRSAFALLFDPARIKPVASFHNFVKENADVVKEFISGKLSHEHINELVDIAAGEARVVTFNDQKVAFYKDEQHTIHAITPTCTHVQCTVTWNESELSWDCPCHGARFSVNGAILNGPAQKPLKRVTFR